MFCSLIAKVFSSLADVPTLGRRFRSLSALSTSTSGRTEHCSSAATDSLASPFRQLPSLVKFSVGDEYMRDVFLIAALKGSQSLGVLLKLGNSCA